MTVIIVHSLNCFITFVGSTGQNKASLMFLSFSKLIGNKINGAHSFLNAFTKTYWETRLQYYTTLNKSNEMILDLHILSITMFVFSSPIFPTFWLIYIWKIELRKKLRIEVHDFFHIV